jgi:hypothetical protein
LLEDTEVMCCEGDKAFYDENIPDGFDYESKTPQAECAKLFQRTSNAKKKDWRQSKSYKSAAYAMYMCPFRKSSCGPNPLVNFYSEKEQGAIHVVGLPKGESCTYMVETVCGAPAFKVANSSGVEVIYNEWQ